MKTSKTSPIKWDKIYQNTEMNISRKISFQRHFLYIYITLMQNPLVIFILKTCSRKHSSIILEAGCGTGRIVFKLSKLKTSSFVIGIDFSSKAIINAKKQSKENNYIFNTDFVIGDIRNLPFKSYTFDFILSLGVIEHFKNPNLLLAEMKRLLKNKGKLLLDTPNRKQFNLSPLRIKEMITLHGHHDFYTPVELANLLQKFGFSILDAFSLDFSWGIIIWYNDNLRKKFSNNIYLNGLITFILRILTLPLNLIFRESGFYSVVLAHI